MNLKKGDVNMRILFFIVLLILLLVLIIIFYQIGKDLIISVMERVSG